MKTVKINYAGIGGDFNKEQNLIYDLLKNNGYDVQITDDPDYLICDISADKPYSYCGTEQIRILHSGENVTPDFNLIDYAISPYPITFGDRHFYLPACVWPRAHWMSLPEKDRNYSLEFVQSKTHFANFITSHESEHNFRGDFFKRLCEYKRVDSLGTYLNNMPNGETVDWLNDSKTEFQRKCKFTLCFESTKHYGFVTEKVMDAFYADTIPVYFGSPTVKEIFNPDAFIYVEDYASMEEAIAKIMELDQDDEKYLEMLRQPILVDPTLPERLEKGLNEFVCNIFDQPVEKAYRRSRVYHVKRFDDYLARAVDSETLTFSNLASRLGKKITQRILRR